MELKAPKAKKINFQILDDLSKLTSDEYAIYIELDQDNYHEASIIKVGLADQNNNYIVPLDKLKDVIEILTNKKIYTYILITILLLLLKERLLILLEVPFLGMRLFLK